MRLPKLVNTTKQCFRIWSKMKRRPQGAPLAQSVQLKFQPKIRPRKAPKAAVAKEEPSETKEDIINKELLAKINKSQINDALGRRFPKNEKKAAPSEVAFGHGNSGVARSFPRVAARGKLNQDNLDLSAVHFEKDYVEPWDYAHTYYPTVVPLRRPYSGDPDILDEEEFGEASKCIVSDETQINHALELGLMEKKEEPQMLFFQFPTKLPLMKQEDVVAGSKVCAGMKQSAEAGAVSKSKIEAGSKKGCKLEGLPPGLMGKIMVYKSGKVKMKLGDAIFDISAGSNCAFAQDVAAINTREKHFCILGDIGRRAVVTPDVDSLIDSLDLDAS